MTTKPLNVIASDGRILGTVQVDRNAVHNLVYFAGPTGWRCWECLSPKEREAFGLEAQDVVRFERVPQ